jgi:hypothetical protein
MPGQQRVSSSRADPAESRAPDRALRHRPCRAPGQPRRPQSARGRNPVFSGGGSNHRRSRFQSGRAACPSEVRRVRAGRVDLCIVRAAGRAGPLQLGASGSMIGCRLVGEGRCLAPGHELRDRRPILSSACEFPRVVLQFPRRDAQEEDLVCCRTWSMICSRRFVFYAYMQILVSQICQKIKTARATPRAVSQDLSWIIPRRAAHTKTDLSTGAPPAQ